MRALIQRVTAAQVVIDESIVGKIDTGMLVLVCAMPKDDVQTANNLAAKIAKLRIFQDEDGRMNKSITDTGGSALVVSQFTLAADTRRGNRPGFSGAAVPDQANALYDLLRRAGDTRYLDRKRGLRSRHGGKPHQ